MTALAHKTLVHITSVTALVAPVATVDAGGRAPLVEVLPIDLGDADAEAILADLVADEGELVLVGLEFADPEQYNTTVTLMGMAELSGVYLPSGTSVTLEGLFDAETIAL